MQKGFSKIVLIIVTAVIVIAGVLYYGSDFKEIVDPVPGPHTVDGCTLEAKICPDGTAVGRVPPSCEFAACPSEISPVPPSTESVPPVPPQIKKDINYFDEKYAGWDERKMKTHCSEQGGTFNSCSSACEDPSQPCIQLCVPACEFDY